MMRLASPAFAAGGPLALPLVEGPPMEFRQLPVSARVGVSLPPPLQHRVDRPCSFPGCGWTQDNGRSSTHLHVSRSCPSTTPDAPRSPANPQEAWVEALSDILILVAQTQRSGSPAQGTMEDLMAFITFCLASPAYVRNPYLRGRLVEVLHALMPPPEDPGSGFNGPYRTQASHAEVAALFQAHPLILDNMVKRCVNWHRCGRLPCMRGGMTRRGGAKRGHAGGGG